MDAREVIAAIENDPVLRAEVRRLVLGETSRQSEEAARQIAIFAAATSARPDQIEAEVAELRSTLDRFVAKTEAMLERLE